MSSALQSGSLLQENTMSDSFARVTGIVLGLDVRSGISSSSGQPYEMHSARVLVGTAGTTSVGYGDDYVKKAQGALPQVGQALDVLVRLRGGKFLNVDAVEPWADGPSALPGLTPVAAAAPSTGSRAAS